MVTSVCITCGASREISPLEQPWPFCPNDECEREFVDIVYDLLDGHTLVAMGIDPESRLGQAAIAEARRVKFRWARESYEMKAEAYARNRPRPLKPLYPC